MRMKQESRRQAIMDVAERLFHEKGFDATSMDEITAQLGGSKATLYNYFASKEALFVEVVYRSVRDSQVHLYDTLDPEGELLATLHAFGETYLAFVCQPKILEVQRIVYAEPARANLGRDFYKYGPDATRRQLARYLRACMDRGDLRDDDASLASLHLLMLLQAERRDPLLLLAVEADALPSVAQTVRRALAVFLRAYGVDKTRLGRLVL
ncbi:TetR/AcrR family transcriptional regulator [Paludibacterium yongneupense]|uniref:TetR/AcrR family transcriptional regulator n=1 Tax=Paludibacterium yongneupense TaxID=400061 RepID=UPI000424D65E|nr:TetR/AcrR family transcriptional regulator [Paludibacterium yongneupense]